MSADPSSPTSEKLAMNIHPNIPEHWDAEQALAVFDFLDQLCALIWTRYQRQIIEHLELPVDTEHPRQLDLFGPNDDLPF
jgi:hypothetical protein